MKKDKVVWASVLAPLVLALAGWVNAHSKRVEAETEKYELADSFQEYVEYVMEQQGCEP